MRGHGGHLSPPHQKNNRSLLFYSAHVFEAENVFKPVVTGITS